MICIGCILDGLIGRFSLEGLNEEEKRDLNLVWHRLEPWPDAVEGLTRLKKKYVIATLSNGNTSLLVDMAKYGGLPWDAVLSADTARHFKPDSEVYLMACDHLSVKPAELLMVAAHKNDLRAAQKTGLRTAFVARPMEFGPGGGTDVTTDNEFDLVAEDFNELAAKLARSGRAGHRQTLRWKADRAAAAVSVAAPSLRCGGAILHAGQRGGGSGWTAAHAVGNRQIPCATGGRADIVAGRVFVEKYNAWTGITTFSRCIW